jgi:hypothetical protein
MISQQAVEDGATVRIYESRLAKIEVAHENAQRHRQLLVTVY